MRVLIIEDNKDLAKTLKESLKKDYTVDIAFTGTDGTFLSQVNKYNLIIIDIGLPDMSGVEVCKMTRAAQIKTPILMLTARTTVNDKVTSLDSGADDYLTKPFKLAELRARMRALLRRNPETVTAAHLEAGPLKMDPATKEVTLKGKVLDLRNKEKQILEYLMRHAGRLVTKEALLESTWEKALDVETNTLDVHLSNLRKKLEVITKEKIIKTIYGVGYILEN